MKRRNFILCLLLCLFALPPFALADTRIMVASDLHYLSHAYYDAENPAFRQVIESGAGKATQYSSELLAGLLAEARHQRPDLLLLTGDLTFNGERLSHQELADALRPLMEKGIAVAVLPGNHDINSENAVRFTDTGIEWVENASPEDFARIWRAMLPQTLPGPGTSGVVKLSDAVWVALGDYSVYADHIESHGVATEAHASWIAEAAREAKAAGALLLSASHQTLLSHTAFSSHSFRVLKAEPILDALREADVRLNLAGHMHIQHILTKDGLTEALTEAFCVTPHRYGIVTVSDDGQIAYDAFALCPEHLPEGLSEEIAQFFQASIFKGQRIQLMGMGVFDQQLLDMSRFAAAANAYYFSGTLFEHPELFDDPALALWQPFERSSTFAHYLMVFMREEPSNALHWQSEP